MEHLYADEMKIRRQHIKIRPDAQDIGIGKIALQDRISIRSVPLIPPIEFSRAFLHAQEYATLIHAQQL